jgi:hypothetical protein
MNGCYLLFVLVGEPAEDRRTGPDMLNRTVATMTESRREAWSCSG